MDKMQKVECVNNFKCWECNASCHMKKIFLHDDATFNQMLNSNSKEVAGLLLLNGYSFEEAEDARVKLVLMISIARNEYLKSLKA